MDSTPHNHLVFILYLYTVGGGKYNKRPRDWRLSTLLSRHGYIVANGHIFEPVLLLLYIEKSVWSLISNKYITYMNS